APFMPWPEVVALLYRYTQLEKQGDTGLYHVARIKQWFSYLHKAYPQEADELFCRDPPAERFCLDCTGDCPGSGRIKFAFFAISHFN
ncbi:hypothetical protein ABN09_06995, partial [Morganella morganii]